MGLIFVKNGSEKNASKHSCLHQSRLTRHGGFTLIELVVVIVVLGIVSISLVGIIKIGTQSYVDVSEREKLLRQGSFLIERMNREISAAVPNSVRVAGNSFAHCLEFVPINWSTFYLNLPLAPSTETTVDVIKLTDQAGAIYQANVGNEMGIVYPTESSHIYDSNSQRISRLSACSDDADGDCATDDDADSIIQLTFDDTFELSSPAQRLYLADHTVSYCLRSGEVYRHRANIASTQTVHTTGGVLMAQGLTNVLGATPLSSSLGTQNPFRVIDTHLQRNAYIQLQFIFSRDRELMPFLQEVHIPNVP